MSQAARKIQSHENGAIVVDHQPVENRRILVVDDEVAIGQGIKALLAPEGDNIIPFRRSSRSAEPAAPTASNRVKYDIVVVTSPAQALEEIEKSIKGGNQFAMGFFDVLLGADIDGIELVKRAQALDPNLYAVFVTAYHDRSVDSINEYLGVDKSDRWDYINKPFTDGEIIQKARQVTALWNLQRMKEWHEEKLSEAQKLLLQNERANTVAAVGRSVAHEFGNLLMQIVGHAELAVLKNEPQRMKEALDTILKASDTASNVLGRFKKLAQGGDHRMKKDLVNLYFPLNEAFDLMGYQLRKFQVQIVKDHWDQVLIEANHHALVQVFMNLLINAVHAMPDGGTVHVALKKLNAETAQISFRDTGTGIPEDILPKVVEPLFTTKGSKGSGLGLAICKEIIEIEHGGGFVIRNHPAGGAEVVIDLPTRQPEEVDDES